MQGTLDQDSILFASELLGVATGYGADIANPLVDFFEGRAGELADSLFSAWRSDPSRTSAANRALFVGAVALQTATANTGRNVPSLSSGE